jgi:hypothetical protein
LARVGNTGLERGVEGEVEVAEHVHTQQLFIKEPVARNSCIRVKKLKIVYSQFQRGQGLYMSQRVKKD